MTRPPGLLSHNSAIAKSGAGEHRARHR